MSANNRFRDCHRNFAGVLIIWDRLLGTFEAERGSRPCVYGLDASVSPRHSHETLNCQLVEFAALVAHDWIVCRGHVATMCQLPLSPMP